MTLNEACRLKGLYECDMLEELQQFANGHQNVEQWSVNFMIDYLINIHHNYFSNKFIAVNDYLNRLSLSHNKKFHEIERLIRLIQQMFNKLTDLINYESASLFPYIKRIIHTYSNNEVYGKLFIKTQGKLSAENLEEFHS